MRTLALNSLSVITIFLVASVYSFAQDSEEIVLDSSLVILNAVVTDKDGTPVTSLSKTDFILKDNGVEQKIDFFETEAEGFAAVILLDVSGSMETRVSLARTAAMRFLLGLRPNDFVAVYAFDSKPKLVQDFSNLRDVSERIYDLEAKGMTAMYDAVKVAAEELGKRKEQRRAIIILSDGVDNRSGTSSSKALKAAQAVNATIYTVDMSSIDSGQSGKRAQNIAVLKKFAKRTGGQFVKTPGGQALRDTFRNIVEELGVTHTLGFYTTGLKPDGSWHKLELTSKDGYEVRSREGYFADKD